MSSSIFLGSFFIQEPLQVRIPASQNTRPTLMMRGTTANDLRAWRPISKKKDNPCSIKAFAGEILQCAIWEPSASVYAGWLREGTAFPTEKQSNVLLDRQGVWSRLSLEQALEINLEKEDIEFPATLHPLQLSPWLTFPTKLTKKRWQGVLRTTKLRPGQNALSFLLEDAKKQKRELHFHAIGVTSTISLAPWSMFEGEKDASQPIQLKRLNAEQYQGTLSLHFCGTGRLKGHILDLPTGKKHPFSVENWEPFSTVTREFSFSWSSEQLRSFSIEPTLCHIETDAQIIGLHRTIAVYTNKNFARLNAFPSFYQWFPPYEDIALRFYQVTTKGSTRWLPPQEDWSWSWNDETPHNIDVATSFDGGFIIQHKKTLEPPTKQKHYTLSFRHEKYGSCSFSLSYFHNENNTIKEPPQ